MLLAKAGNTVGKPCNVCDCLGLAVQGPFLHVHAWFVH